MGKFNKKIFLVVGVVIILAGVIFVFYKPADNKIVYPEQEVVVEEGGLPEVFPEDFPLPKGAEVVDFYQSQGEERIGVSMVFTSKEGLTNMKSFYEKNLGEKGWQYELVGEGDNSATLSFEKENKSGFLGIAGQEGGTLISVTIRVE